MIFEQQIEIFQHKRKFLLMIAACVLFICGGIWLLIDESFELSLYGVIPLNNKVLGMIAVLLFGWLLYLGIKKYNRKAPVLILDERGLLDSTAFKNGLDIAWEEINDFKMVRMYNHVYIVPDLKDPEGLVERQEDSMRRRAMNINFRTFNAPVVINVSMLDYNNEELFRLMKARVGH